MVPWLLWDFPYRTYHFKWPIYARLRGSPSTLGTSEFGHANYMMLSQTTSKLHALGIQSYCQRMIGMSNHLVSKVFRFHYHSQKVIGSLGMGHSTKKHLHFLRFLEILLLLCLQRLPLRENNAWPLPPRDSEALWPLFLHHGGAIAWRSSPGVRKGLSVEWRHVTPLVSFGKLQSGPKNQL